MFENRLLYLGGNDGANPRDEVFASTDGATWTEIGKIPNPTTAFGFTVHQGRLWIAGGNGNADNVYVSDDAVTWTLAGNLPMDNHGGSLVSTGTNLLYAGGHNGNLFDWVLSSSDGASWTQVGTLAVPREYHTGVRIAGRMWLVGGQNTTPTPLADVTTTADGASWSPIPALPVARALGPVIEFEDRIWSFGGNNSAGVYSTDGVAPWQVEGANLPPRQAALVARFSPQ